MSFDWNKPTVQMLGRFQPWHQGHTELFKKILQETGQVCIMIRCMPRDDNNPFDYEMIVLNIENALDKEGYDYGTDYIMKRVPNIVDISYGRDVGYTFTEHNLGEDIHNISATKIREKIFAT